MHKGYKDGRKPVRLNRNVRIMSEEEEQNNKVWQQQRLITYLNCLPVSQIMIEKIEADDIISYVSQMPHFKDAQKVIVSSDKDFYQLCNDKTVVYRPVQNQFINANRLVETFGIHPNNFALARAICGDKSDNLDGVGGAGLKTVAKRFPFLSEANTHEINTLLKACEDVEKPLKVHHNILSGEAKIQRNYKMMQLYTPLVSVQASQKIKYAIQEMTPELNKTQCIGLMIEDGIGAYDWSEMFATMKRICLTTSEK
jgi:5'-3' exonuclease